MLELHRTLPAQTVNDFGHSHPVLSQFEGFGCMLVKPFSSLRSLT